MINKLNSIIAVCFFFFACSEEEMVSQNKETNDWEIEGWNIVWQDEFDKDSLDLTKWSREIGGHGWGNNELQFYTDSDSNSYVENGNLTLKAQVVPQGIGSSKGLRFTVPQDSEPMVKVIGNMEELK